MSLSGVSATALSLATDVRSGTIKATEVIDAHLAAIAALDGELNAFVHVLDGAAREAAVAVDRRVEAGEDPGPLAGVPVAVKDNLCLRGAPTTCGSRILEGWSPPYSATVLERLVDAGAILVGKTNMDEFAMGSSTETSVYGPTRNPHDLSRVPGGSSGGSAAAVAAGLAPLALGSDTGGSIRQPAAFCGVVGVKPTYGTVSRFGLVAFASSLDQIGPFARNVADAALLFDVIAGHDPLDSTSLDRPLVQVGPCLADGVAGMRVGVLAELVDGVDADVAARVHEAAEALAAAGAIVEELSVPEVRYGLRVEASDVAAMNSATRAAGFGPEVKRRIMLGTYALSAGYYEAYYGQAMKVRTVIVDAFAAAYRGVDVLLGATTPTTAFPIGAKTGDPLSMYLSDVCTIPTNLAGHAAMSVPFGTGAGGLPVGVQVLAPALGELQMFRVASVLEAAAPPTPAPSPPPQGSGGGVR